MPHLTPKFAAAFLIAFSLPALSQNTTKSKAAPKPIQTQQIEDGTPASNIKNALPPPPSAVDPAGPAVSLESNEPLFDLAAALNACGYDDGLADSAPVRIAIRNEMNQELENSAAARDARDQMCTFIHRRDLGNEANNVAQYISLAVYLSPPPDLAPTVELSEMPPEATGVEGVLPLVRKFAAAINLHLLWLRHRPEYEELVNTVQPPMTRMILETNIYIKEPTSTYSGRRFLVLLEPMLSPNLTNARVYGTDYIVVVSPRDAVPDGAAPGSPKKETVYLDKIRHTYLHYEIEPLINTRAGALDRMNGFLPIIRNAPIPFNFRSDIVAFFTECLIHAIEIRNMDVGFPKPVAPPAGSPRSLTDKYFGEQQTYDREAEQVRRKAVEVSEKQGFVLTSYFYDQMVHFEKDPESLDEDIGAIVYGMEVGREQNHAKQVVFYPQGTDTQDDEVRHSPRQLTGLDLADLDMIKGDTDSAEEIAQKVLDSKPADQEAARAQFILARCDLEDRNADDAIAAFKEVVRLGKDPRSLAWAHIYLGRVYDLKSADDPTLRTQALAEYREALRVRDSQSDTKTAAENGIKQPFVLPKAALRQPDNNDDNQPLDPSGKSEKENYKPTTPQQ